MDKGGTVNVNQHAAQIIRIGGLILPIVLMMYGFMIQIGAVSSTNYAGNLQFFIISAFWVSLGLHQFMYRSLHRISSIIRLSLYHLIAICYILFVSGFSMPFIGGWVVLMMAAYAYFSTSGLRLSIATLFLVAILDVLLNIEQQHYLLVNVLYLTATLLIGIIAVAVSRAHEVDSRELSRSHAEEILQRDRVITIVNNLADAVLSTDNDGVIQIYNAASLSLLDTNNSLTGKNIDDIVKLIDTSNKRFKFLSAFKRAKSVQSRDDLSATISDETIRLSVIYSPIRGANSNHSDEESSDGYVVIIRDITKQKSLEEERDEFISVISHELRTPLTIAEGTLSNAQVMMHRDDIPKSTLNESVDMAHDQVLFLARMVNDLSTLSRAERGVADTSEPIDVKELIQDLYSEYAPQAEEKGLRFNLDLDHGLGNIVASRLYLKELLQNFVTNAIKYTKEGEIVVSVKKSNGKIDFSVKDSGIGISKSDQSHIFEKFYRSEDYRTRETGGTGLGLYVASKLAKKLGTSISMNSRLNHGSTFGFELPVSDEDTHNK